MPHADVLPNDMRCEIHPDKVPSPFQGNVRTKQEPSPMASHQLSSARYSSLRKAPPRAWPRHIAFTSIYTLPSMHTISTKRRSSRQLEHEISCLRANKHQHFKELTPDKHLTSCRIAARAFCRKGASPSRTVRHKAVLSRSSVSYRWFTIPSSASIACPCVHVREHMTKAGTPGCSVTRMPRNYHHFELQPKPTVGILAENLLHVTFRPRNFPHGALEMLAYRKLLNPNNPLLLPFGRTGYILLKSFLSPSRPLFPSTQIQYVGNCLLRLLGGSGRVSPK